MHSAEHGALSAWVHDVCGMLCAAAVARVLPLFRTEAWHCLTPGRRGTCTGASYRTACSGLGIPLALRMLQAVSVALREWPDVNASLGGDGRSLLRHHAHNLGVAMATPSGLVVRTRALWGARSRLDPSPPGCPATCRRRWAPTCRHVTPGLLQLSGLCAAAQQYPLHTPHAHRGGHAVCSGIWCHPVHVWRTDSAPLGCMQVPNIKRVQDRSIPAIAQELARLQAAARAERLPPEDLAGGTLTVSNIGAIGGTYATPLVNVPEAAIVALGR